MKGILLFFIALFGILFTFLLGTIFSIVYYAILFWKFKTALKKISLYFNKMALSLDQFGNVNNSQFFNHILIKKENRKRVIGKDYIEVYRNGEVVREYFIIYDFHPFGDEDDTLSYVIAMNYKKGSLSRFGKFWANFLNWVDKKHLEKAIKNKYYRDIEAYKRLVKNGFKIDK